MYDPLFVTHFPLLSLSALVASRRFDTARTALSFICSELPFSTRLRSEDLRANGRNSRVFKNSIFQNNPNGIAGFPTFFGPRTPWTHGNKYFMCPLSPTSFLQNQRKKCPRSRRKTHKCKLIFSRNCQVVPPANKKNNPRGTEHLLGNPCIT